MPLIVNMPWRLDPRPLRLAPPLDKSRATDRGRAEDAKQTECVSWKARTGLKNKSHRRNHRSFGRVTGSSKRLGEDLDSRNWLLDDLLGDVLGAREREQMDGRVPEAGFQSHDDHRLASTVCHDDSWSARRESQGHFRHVPGIEPHGLQAHSVRGLVNTLPPVPRDCDKRPS